MISIKLKIQLPHVLNYLLIIQIKEDKSWKSEMFSHLLATLSGGNCTKSLEKMAEAPFVTKEINYEKLDALKPLSLTNNIRLPEIVLSTKTFFSIMKYYCSICTFYTPTFLLMYTKPFT